MAECAPTTPALPTQSQSDSAASGRSSPPAIQRKVAASFHGDFVQQERPLAPDPEASGGGRSRFKQDESHPWVQTMRGGQSPGRGGAVGHHQGRHGGSAAAQRVNPLYARAAAIGYLLPINAHYLIEILIGAASVDGPAPVPQDFGVYLHVEPFNGKGLYQDGDFWKAVEATEAKNRGGKGG